MDLFRQGISRGAFISEMDAPEREPVLATDNFQPKVLISSGRAEAIIAAGKTEFTHSIYRTVPLATRVQPLSTAHEQFGDKTIISMASSLEDTTAELGRTYGKVSAGQLSDWVTDVIRIERFNADSTPQNDGDFSFTLYAPE